MAKQYKTLPRLQILPALLGPADRSEVLFVSDKERVGGGGETLRIVERVGGAVGERGARGVVIRHT